MSSSSPITPRTAAPVARAAYVLDPEARIGNIVCRILLACGRTPRQFAAPLPFLAQLKARRA